MNTSKHDANLLAAMLIGANESEYVRFTGTWLSRVTDWRTAPQQTNNEVVDAFVAAASSYAALANGEPEPKWANGNRLKSFWYGGHPGLFAWSFAHTPGPFKSRGLIVEDASLISV